jgi:hypothetical protein
MDKFNKGNYICAGSGCLPETEKHVQPKKPIEDKNNPNTLYNLVVNE